MIVFCTTVYWYGPSAKMKLHIDLLRPYVEANRLRRKRAILVSPSAEGPVAFDPLLEMFRRMFLYLKMEFAGKVLVKAYYKCEIAENRKELKKAFALRASL